VSDIENKLATARTRLILDKPFLGALVLRLPMVEGDPSWCESTYSDGKTLYYNSDYIDALDADQTQFALSHEALHCALSHFYRRGHRVKHRWELACDFAVNPLLINDGLKPTPEAMYLREYEGMTAEEIYPCLDDEDDDSERDLERNSDSSDTQDDDNQDHRDMGDGGSDEDRQQRDSKDGSGDETEEPDGSGGQGASKPNPLSQQELEDLSTQWQQRLAAAAQTALQNGKLEGEMARMVDFLLQPKLPWRMLLARFMTMTARDDYSYSRPSSRRGDPAVYPSLRSHETNVVVVVDTSGSISADEIQEFISEIDAIKSQVRARITLLTCDSELNYGCPWYFEPWDEFAMDIDIRGGGGTDFKPAFDWVAEQDRAPDLLMYFTDTEGLFPKTEPMYPVLWLVKGKGTVPFGNRIQLN
jgi:predicted metal-dependent peptidase